MFTNKQLMAALEPIFGAIRSLSNAIDNVSLTPGPQGPQGPQGEKGLDGKDGESVAGQDGKDGKDGESIVGPQGEKGLDGKDGIDGVSPDHAEVAEVLSLDQTFIKSVTPNIHPAEVAQQLVELYLPVIKGADGAGIDTVRYDRGEIYRAGSVVVANVGQYFRATKDTNGVPSESADWTRIGNNGFRHTGVYSEDKNYLDGDIFTKDFGSFVMMGGEPVLLAGRGAKGERGAVGPSGIAGKEGRNGSQLVSCSVQGFKAVLVMELSDGGINHVEMDFEPAVKAQFEILRADLLQELTS